MTSESILANDVFRLPVGVSAPGWDTGKWGTPTRQRGGSGGKPTYYIKMLVGLCTGHRRGQDWPSLCGGARPCAVGHRAATGTLVLPNVMLPWRRVDVHTARFLRAVEVRNSSNVAADSALGESSLFSRHAAIDLRTFWALARSPALLTALRSTSKLGWTHLRSPPAAWHEAPCRVGPGLREGVSALTSPDTMVRIKEFRGNGVKT